MTYHELTRILQQCTRHKIIYQVERSAPDEYIVIIHEDNPRKSTAFSSYAAATTCINEIADKKQGR